MIALSSIHFAVSAIQLLFWSAPLFKSFFMFKNRKLLAFCLTAVVAISGASYWWQVARFQETTDNAYVHSDIVHISAKQAGFAEAGWIHDNQPVHKGEVLARIESTDYQLKVDQSMAEVSSAQATVEQLEAQHKLQESLIRVASAQLDSAAAERELSAAELKRVNSLFAKGVMSKDELENAQAVDKKALAQLTAQKANLESTRLQLTVLDSQISKAGATLQQAQSQLAIARQYLAETVITAPRDGIIGRRQVKDGQLLKSGSVLFSLVDSRTVWVTANFKETQIGQMKIGQPVELEFDAYSGQPVTGYIDSIWPASGGWPLI